MTTYTLKMTPPDAPPTTRRGLSREEALWAIAELVYGFEEPRSEDAAAEEQPETRTPVAA
jgi:hypothetical protein